MNLEAINKWLDEEYGCSYTRLEELHDFYFEKYCDLKKENKQIKDKWNKLKEYCKENTLCYEVGDDENTKLIGSKIHGLNVLDKMQELEQGSDSNE